MTRPLRIELSGGLYHITARGDRREDIYFDTADRQPSRVGTPSVPTRKE
jgi:hypothetical protein